jgi:hypothetical protein
VNWPCCLGSKADTGRVYVPASISRFTSTCPARLSTHVVCSPHRPEPCHTRTPPNQPETPHRPTCCQVGATTDLALLALLTQRPARPSPRAP